MASSLLNIAASGVRAARVGLDLTSQNIANAGTEGYVRRSVRLAEVASAGGYNRIGDLSVSGVRVDGITRNADLFRQAEVRRTGSDAARAGAELAGLENAEAALEQSNFFPSLTAFEASLQDLASDTVNPALRATVLESARTLTRTINIAANALDQAGESLRFEAADGVAQVNLLASELGRVNLQLTRAAAGTSDQTSLLDQRDNLLQKLSGFVDVATTIAPDRTVQVRIGGTSGPLLVTGGTVATLSTSTAADGTIAFALSGSPVTLAAGSLTGKAQALAGLRDHRSELDGIANALIAAANGAQAGGVALDGSAGQPLFSGTGAAGLTLALTSGAQLATAPAGAGAGSRDPANLAALRGALATAKVSARSDALLFNVSSEVAGRKTTSQALATIASSAQIALDQQSGVDLDQEAVNLVRYQQAFQASSKAIQVAADLFDTLLALR